MTSAPAPIPVPDHIPAHLIGGFPFTPGSYTTERPHDIAQRLQDEDGPEVWYARQVFADGGAWVFRRAADMRAIALNTDHFANKDFSPYAQLTGGGWSMIPSEQDPPVHSMYRMLLNPIFAPKEISRLNGQIAMHARNYVEAFRERGSCEVMADFAFKFPIEVFMGLMNLPRERLDEFMTWEHQLIHGSDLSKMQAASQAAVDYLRQEIADRRNNLGDDFISFAIRADLKGRPLTETELLGMCFNLFVGGLDTVSTHMGHFLRHLAENPQDQALLRANPALISGAVDELLRAYSSSITMRTCIKDIEVHDVLIRAGDRVAMVWPLAGRDPLEYDDPATIRFDRKPRQMAMGFGPHLCLGLYLARRELTIAMATFLELLPEFRIADGAEIVCDLGGVIQAKAIPIVWDA